MRVCTVAFSVAWLFCLEAAVLAQQGSDSTAPATAQQTPAAADASSATASPSPPLYTRQTAFAIPFAIEKNAGPPRDVLLYVSADRGANWTLYARQAGPQGQFLFRAARDGEYWFAPRTTTAGGLPPADNLLRAEQRVAIDTLQPRLNVRTTVGTAGEIQVSWEASDETLVPQSLKVEYQADAETTWRPVSLSRPAESTLSTLVGQTSFRPDVGTRSLNVRVEISDRAGNVARIVKRTAVSSSAVGASPSWPNVPGDPLGLRGIPEGGQTPRPGEPQPSGRSDQSAASPQPRGETWASDKSPARLPATTEPDAALPRPARTLAASTPNSGAGTKESTTPGYPSTDSGRPPASGAAEPAAQPDNAGGLPPGERPRMTSSKRFNLDYSVDAVGAAGVEKVELWITRNGGRDWHLWDIDKDNESPIEVELDGEGIYGFRVVIVGKNGLASQTPRPGDLADLWVGVDMTKPTVEITSAAYGEGPNAGHLEIRWKAVDDHFGARPITLQFSDQPDGKWTTIAAGLPNSGEYSWRVDSSVPDQFYLRLEARDEAGNVASYQLDKAIASAGLSPRGHIRGVEPTAR